jgi:hypothetical protein
MPDDKVPSYMKVLWEGLNQDPLQISPEQRRIEAGKLHRTQEWRFKLGIGWVLSATVSLIAFIVVLGIKDHEPIQQIVMETFVVGFVTTLMFTLQWRRPDRLKPDLSPAESLRSYRAALVRERAFYWGWVRIGLLVIGGVGQLFFLALAVRRARSVLPTSLLTAFWFALIVFSVRLGRSRTRILRRRIDALDESLNKEKEGL